jgi:hypothetical protein
MYIYTCGRVNLVLDEPALLGLQVLPREALLVQELPCNRIQPLYNLTTGEFDHSSWDRKSPAACGVVWELLEHYRGTSLISLCLSWHWRERLLF